MYACQGATHPRTIIVGAREYVLVVESFSLVLSRARTCVSKIANRIRFLSKLFLLLRYLNQVRVSSLLLLSTPGVLFFIASLRYFFRNKTILMCIYF